MNTQKRSVWRELLDSLIQVRSEHERIAAQIGVAPVTLTRWASGETSPRLQNLHLLLQAIPEQHRAVFQMSIEEDLPSHSFDEPIRDEERLEIPFQVVSRVFSTEDLNWSCWECAVELGADVPAELLLVEGEPGQPGTKTTGYCWDHALASGKAGFIPVPDDPARGADH